MKNKRNRNYVFTFTDVVIIIIFTSLIMCFLGSALVYKKLDGIDYNKYVKDVSLKSFIKAYDEVNKKYYEDVDSSALIEDAINGMYSNLDKYSTYMNKDSTDALNESLAGKYTGIGIKVLSGDNAVVIEDVYEGSPAAEANIMVGDVLLEINDQSVRNMKTEAISDIIKNNKKVKIKIKRGEEEFIYNLAVKTLYVPTVTSDIIEYNNKKIGFIKIKLFNSTTFEQFKSKLNDLEDQKIDSLIIDVRQNSGGYLSVCANIAELFLENDKVIYKLESKNEKKVIKDKTEENRNYRIDVLIDNSSASASEVLAASLRDSYGAKLVGMKSLGKGKVQEKVTLSSSSSVKFTTAKWLTPNNVCIDNVGLTPDIEINEDIKDYNLDNKMSDTQINAAVIDLST